MEFINREQGRKSSIAKGSRKHATCTPHLPPPPPAPWEALVVPIVVVQESNNWFELCFDIKLGNANEEDTGGGI